MTEKIILPKKVAGAIEVLRTKFHYDLYQLIGVAHDIHEPDDYEDEDEVHSIATIEEYSQGNYDTIISAIVIGYEVENSPEEKVREYYASVIRFKGRAEENGNQYRVGEIRGELGGIETTLNLLGIEIEGVSVN